MGVSSRIGIMQRGLLASCLSVVCATGLQADSRSLRYNTYGAPGLVEMPSASSAPDAELAFTVSHASGEVRNSALFQVTPRFSVGLRYASLRDLTTADGQSYDRLLDRSFSLQYRMLDEHPRRPAVSVGVTDFVGTGVYAAEYLVATKSIHPKLDVTLGLGWGRLAGEAEGRPNADFGLGGTARTDQLFRGEPDVFGGVHWQGSRLGLTVEYSTDTYEARAGEGFDLRHQVNFGANYVLSPNLIVAAHYLYGTELGAQLTYTVNPLRPPFGTGLAAGPDPLLHVPRRADLNARMKDAGLRLLSAEQDGTVLRVAVENEVYQPSAQAIGRAARVLANHADPSALRFEIALCGRGICGQSMKLVRSQLIAQEFSAPPEFRVATNVQSAVVGAGLDLQLHPYATVNLFDPDDPLRADFGVALEANYSPWTGVVVAAELRQKVIGNLDEASRTSDSVLPRVRSDFALYDREGDIDLIRLTGAIHWQLRSDVYARLTAGALEEMFAGFSTEVLWAPHTSDWAFGVELNHVWQRGYDSDFEFLDYDISTGHVSAYWQVNDGYTAQLDIGRYLAGDWGGTLTVSRRFANGWSIGAFATLSDVLFEDFGEGSFDKGVVVEVPLSWVGGDSTRERLERTIRPVTRDGGARLQVDGRLYDLTRPLSNQAISESWGMFWR